MTARVPEHVCAVLLYCPRFELEALVRYNFTCSFLWV
jgi:hypothetical protein